LIYALFGLPGSGKSYYAVYEFISKRIETGTVISNIVLSEDVDISDSYVYLSKYDMDNLHKNIKKIMEDSTKSHDDKKVLLSYLFGLYGKGDITLIVDECHLYGYRGRSSNIAWVDDFLSIHRHIFTDRKFDVVLITQVPSRLNSEIANQVEVAVKAVPASQRLITSMLEYSVYGSVDALKKSDKTMRMKRQILKGDPKIFDLYQSGFVNKGSNDFRKKFGLILLGVILVFSFVVYQFKGLISGEKLPGHTPIKTVKASGTKIKNIDANLTRVDYSKKFNILCKPLPLDFDTKKISNWLYSIIKDNYKLVCYRRYINNV